MASSKKSGPSKRRTPKKKTAPAKIEDAVIIDDKAAADPVVDAPTDSVIPDKTATDTSSDAVTAQDAIVEDVVVTDAPADAPESETPKFDDAAADAPKDKDESKVADAPAPVHQPVPVAPPAEKSRSIFLPLVLGGIIAGGLGYAASEYRVFGGADEDPTAALRAELTAQQERIAALEAVEAPEIPTVDLTPIETQLGDVESGIADVQTGLTDMQAGLDGLDTRIVALEERPVVVAAEGVDAEAIGQAAAAAAANAYTAELETLQASVKSQRDEISALLNDAKDVEEAAAQAAVVANGQAAIAKIVSAIDAGQPFDGPFAELQALDIGDLDPALGDVAADGVSSLSALQDGFPDQARAALATARASGAEDGQQGLGGFLKRSLGARSVAPREGNDPDAVLSRAEAAIKSGDLNTTLTELDALPEEAQAAIADWRTAADARVAARAAADALAQRLTAD